VIEVDRSGDSCHLHLEGSEAGLLRRLIQEMRIALEARPDGDAVTQRLFPDAYDSAVDARAYRDLVRDDLLRTKLSALDRVAAALQGEGRITVSLQRDDVDAWLATLTDMRLAIGTRLDVDEDTMSREPDPADASFPAMSVLHWLGWLQESILQAETG
jgi:hypothetical protein